MGTNPYEKKETKVKWYRTFKFKVISIVTAFILMVSVGVVAVIAATQQNAKIQTKISFHATDVSANVRVRMIHYGLIDYDGYSGNYSVTGSTNLQNWLTGTGWTDFYDEKLYTITTSDTAIPNLTCRAQTFGELGGEMTMPTKDKPSGSEYTSYNEVFNKTTYVSFLKYYITIENGGDRLLRVTPTISITNGTNLETKIATVSSQYGDSFIYISPSSHHYGTPSVDQHTTIEMYVYVSDQSKDASGDINISLSIEAVEGMS